MKPDPVRTAASKLSLDSQWYLAPGASTTNTSRLMEGFIQKSTDAFLVFIKAGK
jgi:hypothetical protein